VVPEILSVLFAWVLPVSGKRKAAEIEGAHVTPFYICSSCSIRSITLLFSKSSGRFQFISGSNLSSSICLLPFSLLYHSVGSPLYES
jgi:hypothetical protein